MTPEQFVYWLQGKLEGRSPKDITEDDVRMIQEHLQTIFHKVTPHYDPTFPPPSIPNERQWPDVDPTYPRVIC